MRRYAKASSAGTAAGRAAHPVRAGLALAIVLLTCLALASFTQAKVVVGGFGTSGTLGGQFAQPRGIDVNQAGSGGVPAGTVYVVDSQSRVQRFSSSGAFERAWGQDVLIGGVTTFEICTVAAECKAGSTTGTTDNGGQLNNPQGIVVNQTTGHVYVTEQTNRRVSEFDADGAFVRTWGWDVVSTGKANDVGTNAFEVCDTTAGNVAADCKQAAAAGTGGGRFGAGIGYPTLDSSGNVLVSDPSNSRIQEFSSAGAFLKAVGTGVITDGAEGTGNLTNGSTTVGNLVTTRKFFEVGQAITAPSGIQAGTTITAVAATTLTLSKAADTTVTGQTLTVAEGAGNAPVNETQTIAVSGAPTAGRFNVGFLGQSTGATGTAKRTNTSKTLTNLSVTTGAFFVGQPITGVGIAPGAEIVAINGGTIEMSQAAISGNSSNTSITAYDIPYNASAATVQAQLESLSNISPGDVGVAGPAGGPWTITFEGSRYGGADVPQLTAPFAFFPSGSAAVTSANAGAFEVCGASAECRAGAPGVSAGQFSTGSPGDLALDGSGNLYALDTGNGRVQRINSTLTSASVFGSFVFTPYTGAAPERVRSTQAGTHLVFAVNNNVSANERQLLDLDLGDEEIKDVSLVGSGLTNVSGLAERPGGDLYATSTTTNSIGSILLLSSTPLLDPEIGMDPISVHTDTTAVLGGTVDPKGGKVTCKYQYSTDQLNWTDVPEPGCGGLVGGGGPQAISENVTGLTPNTHYFARLAVSRPLVAKSTKTTSAEEFVTDAVPPVVSNIGAVQVADTSVRLVGTINPRHSVTEYVFQYGPTPATETSTTPIDIGDSATPLILSQVIENLAPNTEYFFKVVATNPAGQATSETATVTTRATPLPLPDDRAWEQVSLADKNFYDAAEIPSGAQLGLDGEGAVYNAFGNFGTPPGQAMVDFSPYAARRAKDGWHSGSVIPPFCAFDYNSTVEFGYAEPRAKVDPNIEHGIVHQGEFKGCEIAPLSPSAPLPAENLYRESFVSDPFAKTNFQLLASEMGFAFGAPNFRERTGSFEGGSLDFSHVVYSSTGQQSPDAPPADGTRRLFDWHDGTVSLVSREPVSNSPFPGETALAATDPLQASAGIGERAVSDDGNRIFFYYPTFGQAQQIYMRDQGIITYRISEPECSSSCGEAAPPAFEAANPTGSKVAFTSTEKLTDSDTQTGKDLYLYSHSPDPDDPGEVNLSLVSKDAEPADGSTGTVLGFYGMSDDANTVFFVAGGQLVSGQPTGAGPKLYRWQWNDGAPAIDYLATLQPTGEETARWELATNRQVTPSGSSLVLATITRITPVADQDTDFDVYRWNAEENWECLSCQLPGLPSVGPSKTGPLSGLQISDDGTRVPFTSVDALVADDINGELGCPSVASNKPKLCQDVYEWHDGAVNLISSGLSTSFSKVWGVSRSGRDILFSTRQRLVGWDTDENSDVYDARIGGGFPEPPIEPAPCEGEACREAGTGPSPGAGAGTAVFEGPSNGRKLNCLKTFRRTTVNGRTVCKRKRARGHRQRNKQRDHRRNQQHGTRGAR